MLAIQARNPKVSNCKLCLNPIEASAEASLARHHCSSEAAIRGTGKAPRIFPRAVPKRHNAITPRRKNGLWSVSPGVSFLHSSYHMHGNGRLPKRSSMHNDGDVMICEALRPSSARTEFRSPLKSKHKKIRTPQTVTSPKS